MSQFFSGGGGGGGGRGARFGLPFPWYAYMLEGHVCNPCWGFIFYVESFQLKSRGCVLSELALGRIWRPMCDWLTDEGRRKGKKKKARMNVNDSCSLTFLWYVKNNAVVLNNPRGLLRSLLSFFFLFLNRHPSRAIWAGMFWYAAVTDKNTAQPVFSFISPTSLYFF